MPEPAGGEADSAAAPEPEVLAGLVPLPLGFYQRPVLVVARALIGKVLVHHSPEGSAAGRIVETEAYRGPEDLAAHSAGGRRTRRNEAMWGPAGRVYMFLLYGMHWAFNVVTGDEGAPHAVLVRALEPLAPRALMASRRGMDAARRELCNGPGKLCAALGLDGSHGGASLTAPSLFIAEAARARGAGGRPSQGGAGRRGRVGRSARINIDYAGAWVHKPWRFYERGNRYVSVRPRE